MDYSVLGNVQPSFVLFSLEVYQNVWEIVFIGTSGMRNGPLQRSKRSASARPALAGKVTLPASAGRADAERLR